MCHLNFLAGYRQRWLSKLNAVVVSEFGRYQTIWCEAALVALKAAVSTKCFFAKRCSPCRVTLRD